jgi:hypothetical protein
LWVAAAASAQAGRPAQTPARAGAANAPAGAVMPAVEQQALVRKYCAVCHTDASMNGGLSLQHYDPGVPNPPLAAMLFSKLENNAMGAAGLGIPDRLVRDAWLASTREQARGATRWTVLREVRMGTMPAQVLTASIVREAPARPKVTGAPVYRLTMTCDAAIGVGDVQLTWSPEPRTNVTMSTSVDGGAPVPHEVTGTERQMGNGTSIVSGLAATTLQVPLAQHSLTVSGLFPGDSVEFPIGDLRDEVRREFAACFPTR